MNGTHKPWVKLMRDKYGCGANLGMWVKKPAFSHIWKCVYNAKDILASGTKWIVGNGENISIGKDWQCGHDLIKNNTTLNEDLLDMNVSTLINDNGHWNENIMINVFPNCMIDSIQSVSF